MDSNRTFYRDNTNSSNGIAEVFSLSQVWEDIQCRKKNDKSAGSNLSMALKPVDRLYKQPADELNKINIEIIVSPDM